MKPENKAQPGVAPSTPDGADKTLACKPRPAKTAQETGLRPRALLHGRRRGRKLGPRQALLLDSALPALALDSALPILDPARLFPDPVSAVWLEIGFGGGEHLAAEATAHPETGFIGCEIFLNGLAKALALVEAQRLRNVRLYNCDARDIIAALPPGALAGVYLLYPDPWPKRRHQNRRFLSREMLARLHDVMRPGAVLRVATDIDAYAAWTLAQVRAFPGFAWMPSSAGDWQRPWDGWSGTRYEAKALREGRKPVYLAFHRK